MSTPPTHLRLITPSEPKPTYSLPEWCVRVAVKDEQCRSRIGKGRIVGRPVFASQQAVYDIVLDDGKRLYRVPADRLVSLEGVP